MLTHFGQTPEHKTVILKATESSNKLLTLLGWRLSFLGCLILKIKALRFVETSAATIYQAILRNKPEDLELQPTNFNTNLR